MQLADALVACRVYPAIHRILVDSYFRQPESCLLNPEPKLKASDLEKPDFDADLKIEVRACHV